MLITLLELYYFFAGNNAGRARLFPLEGCDFLLLTLLEGCDFWMLTLLNECDFLVVTLMEG